MDRVNIFWFRRDLRIDDNRGLFNALRNSGNVLCIFIYDELILQKLDNKKDLRLSFITDQLKSIKQQLEKNGSSLLTLYGKPVEVIEKLAQDYPVKTVFANQDYEPYARDRDAKIEKLLKNKGIGFITFKDQVIFEKEEVTKDDGRPYTVFTPYMKKWREAFNKTGVEFYPSTENLDKLYHHEAFNEPAPEKSGFGYVSVQAPSSDPPDSLLQNYDRTRNFPALNGTSRLSVHLRFGTISIRKLVDRARRLNDVFLSELIWREFYMMILWHFPHVVEKSFKPAYDRIKWVNDEKHFEAWCEGRTGYPIVDAGMRQLSRTGYMHNRVRMITASFLTKHLLTDWRWGEAWFAKKLLDYELSSNNGGWQWAAGSGCDAAPYFRIFNPTTQTKKFDPGMVYIRKWVSELDSSDYPKPVVEHKAARERALKTYKNALT